MCVKHREGDLLANLGLEICTHSHAARFFHAGLNNIPSYMMR